MLALLHQKFSLNFIVSKKRFLIRVIADLIAIVGVLYFSWNPSRMVAFYILDTFVIIFCFITYSMLIEKAFSIATLALGLSLTLLMATYLGFLLDSPIKSEQFGEPADLMNLLYPYFDVTSFLASVIFANCIDLKKWLSFDFVFAKPAYGKILALHLAMVPMLVFGWVIVYIFVGNQVLSIIISLILVRHFIEYQRAHTFKYVEQQMIDMIETKNGYFNQTFFNQYIEKKIKLFPFPQRLNPDGETFVAHIEKQIRADDTNVYYLTRLYSDEGKQDCEYCLLSPKQIGTTEFDPKKPVAGLLRGVDSKTVFDAQIKEEQLDFIYWVEIEEFK
jgi:hypothetical protein